MPVSICPRCQHVNPEYAVYCHFDGVVLQAHQQAAAHRLPSEFVFPSGRRCKTFDELAQGCQEEWTAARDLLMRGVFAKYFRACNRADLVRAAEDAKAQTNPDIALNAFLDALPGTRTQTPKLDLHPRRILLGTLMVGEAKTVPLTITNQGHGMLQGTVSVTEGQDWLSLSDKRVLHETDVGAVREQVIPLSLDTKGIAAGQSYGARLTVVTNGGVVEVPLRMELAPQPYPKAPFQGARTSRELAEKMRGQPKAAVPVLENGDVQRWFSLNGWTYPIHGAPVKGIAGVQQFFEGLGHSKPPPLEISPPEVRLSCKPNEIHRTQVTLHTKVKKWVYAQVSSDSAWLKVVHPQVTGPQRAGVSLEIDTNLWKPGNPGEGKVTLLANGGQKLTLKVVIDIPGEAAALKPTLPPTATFAPGPPPTSLSRFEAPAYRASAAGSVKFIPALVTTVLLCLALRVVMIPLADLWGRASVTAAAAEKLGFEPKAKSPFAEAGGWLQLPWLPILAGVDTKFPAKVFQPGSNAEVSTLEFRHYFASYFIRWFVLWTGWTGAIVGAILVMRRSGVTDLPWGIVAGAFAGFAGSATLAAFFLAVEMIPHIVWHLAVGAHAGASYVFLWSVLAVLCWFVVGIALGFMLPWIAPLRRLLIDPFQAMIASTFRIAGMKSLADYWAPR